MRHKQPKKPHRTETQHYVPQFYLRGLQRHRQDVLL